MRLALPSLVLFAYIATSLIWFLPWRVPAKISAGGALLVICSKYLIYEMIGGSFFAPDLPRPFLLAMEALFASVVILFFLLLLKDILTLVLWLMRFLGNSRHLPFTPAVRGAALVSAALVLGAYGTWQSVRIPDVHTVEIFLPKIPRQLDGFSIVQITDIHIGPLLKGDWLQGVVEKANALSPDLVVLTGDMVDGSPDKLKADIAPLAGLRARYGVYGVTGNHEYYFGSKIWLPIFEKMGIQMLHNQHRTISVGGARFVIAGVPDHYEPRFGGPGPDLQKALKDAPEGVRVLLAHRPLGARGNAGVDIQLSGHTHGGLLFFLKPLIAAFNGGYINGLYETNGMKLYVSPGTGMWTGFSCRLGVPSEITRIVLRKRN